MIANRAAFGRYQFDVTQRMLFCDGDLVPLGRRMLLLLEVLLRRRGDVVPKDDLMEAAWPDETVEDSNLSVQISQLRRLIGSQWIRTVERVGYRFILEGPAAGASVEPPRLGVPSLAVLAFADLSETGCLDRISAGFVEDLTTALAQFKSLVIASRSAGAGHGSRAADVRRIASDLGARYMLAGSVRLTGDRLKINAQLIDGVSGIHLWAKSFERDARDSIVDALAAAVEAEVHAAEITRSRYERPESQEAYDFYLRARHKIRSSRADDNAVAITLYARALELEPDNTLYLAGAAEAFHHRSAVGWAPLTGNDRAMTRDLTWRGLDQPDPDAASLALFGNASFSTEEIDFGSAVTERAAGMTRSSPLALICDATSHIWAGSIDQAELLFTRALSLNPNDPNQRFALGGLAGVYRIRDEFEQSLQMAKRAFAVSQGYSTIHWQLIVASVYLGKIEDARRYLARYRTIAPDATLNSIRRGQPFADESRVKTLLDGLRLAGLPER